MLLRVGSRGSRLALTQAERAAEVLRRPCVEIALVPITTAGDRDRTRPFGEIGSRGVFVKELEEALLEGRIDVAIHSSKDMTFDISPNSSGSSVINPKKNAAFAISSRTVGPAGRYRASILRPGLPFTTP